MSNFKAWAKDVALRAVKTAAQAAGAVITANTAGLTHVPFGTVADVAGLAALICVLQNLSNLKVPTFSDALAVDFFKSVDRSAPRVGNSAIGVNGTVTTPDPIPPAPSS